jgi:hypothetical protein
MSYFGSTIITDVSTDNAEVTPYGELKVTQVTRLAGEVFNDGIIDSNYYTTTTANGGTATTTASVLSLALTTTSGSSSAITSTNIARYVGFSANVFRSTLRVGDTGAANNVRKWGAMDGVSPVDGYYFQLSGTTFSIVTLNTSTPTVVSSGSFNGPTTGGIFTAGASNTGTVTLDTNFHAFEIVYQSRKAQFFIDGTLIHTVTCTTASLAGTKNLKPTIINANTGVGTAVNIYAESVAIARLGPRESQNLWYHIAGANAGVQLKTGPGTLSQVNVNSSSAATYSFYDGTSATNPIAIISTPNNNSITTFSYDIDFNTGLHVVTTGASADCTISYE